MKVLLEKNSGRFHGEVSERIPGVTFELVEVLAGGGGDRGNSRLPEVFSEGTIGRILLQTLRWPYARISDEACKK